jgi:hypothetical protein
MLHASFKWKENANTADSVKIKTALFKALKGQEISE